MRDRPFCNAIPMMFAGLMSRSPQGDSTVCMCRSARISMEFVITGEVVCTIVP